MYGAHLARARNKQCEGWDRGHKLRIRPRGPRDWELGYSQPDWDWDQYQDPGTGDPAYSQLWWWGVGEDVCAFVKSWKGGGNGKGERGLMTQTVTEQNQNFREKKERAGGKVGGGEEEEECKKKRKFFFFLNLTKPFVFSSSWKKN